MGILRGDHDIKNAADDTVKVARKFAIRTMKELSGTEISTEEIDVWAAGAETPFRELEGPQRFPSAFSAPFKARSFVALSQCIDAVEDAGGDQDAAIRICRDATGVGLSIEKPTKRGATLDQPNSRAD